MASHYTYTVWVYLQRVAYTVGYSTIDSWGGTLQYGKVQEIIICISNQGQSHPIYKQNNKSEQICDMK